MKKRIAVCINCGLIKSSVFKVCHRCGFDPSQDSVAKAKSIRLSNLFSREDTGEPIDARELHEISSQIEAGVEFEFDQREIEKLLEEKALLDQGIGWVNVLRIILFLIALMVPGAVGIYLALN